MPRVKQAMKTSLGLKLIADGSFIVKKTKHKRRDATAILESPNISGLSGSGFGT
jgi:hypothetical protein